MIMLTLHSCDLRNVLTCSSTACASGRKVERTSQLIFSNVLLVTAIYLKKCHINKNGKHYIILILPDTAAKLGAQSRSWI